MNISKSKYKILSEAERRLKNLSPKRLIVANDILAYLEDRESSDASQELLNLPGFEEAFRNASQQAKKCEVIKFNRIRRNV